MADAVLSASIQVLLEKLTTTALSELRSLRRVKEDLEGMATTLSMIQALIEDAEAKQVKDKAIRIWLTKLKDVACEIDEVLDDYRAQSQSSSQLNSDGRSSSSSSRTKALACCLFPCPCHTTLFHCKMTNRIKDIRERLDRTVRDRDMLGLQVQVPEGTTSLLELTARPQSTSLVDDANVFGRDEDRENIVKILLTVSVGNSCLSRLNISVLPIVGMGGLGKTTLTQLVYNDSRVKDHFQLRLWICVSESFDVMKLTKETLESTSISGYSTNVITNMNKLQESLSAELKGKLFLLVLDDVWNEDPNKWYSFCSALIGARRGSKIIVTTRNENVGRIMCGLPPYRLAQLSDSDCWRLFRNCAFVGGDSTGHPNLEKIGKEIVKKLKGLPLAAKALGSLLYSKTDEEDWKNILRSEIWELPPDKNNILPALRLSYNHLPPHLKQCFSYCSVFHKDYVFDKKKMVQIWMALGFVQPQGRIRLEDIGSSYFDDLLKRSFFQAHKGNYVMHDATHDLAQLISDGACLRLEDVGGVKHTRPDAHHLSYSCSNSGLTSFEVFHDFRRLQSLLLLRGYRSRVAPVPRDLFLRQKWLRVLDLNRRDIAHIPFSIGNLKQLRYLRLSGTGIETLPSSLGGLYNLQTLKLKYCDALMEIPEGVTNLVNLRHLEASATLISKIGRIGRLTALQELEEFAVRNDRRFGIRELQDMGELRGRLSIRNLENVADGEEANQARLSAKTYLGVLEFLWADDRRVDHEDGLRDQDVLQGLRPHVDIKEITVKGYSGAEFPRWLGSSTYSSLETIHLSNCRRCNLLPSLCQLPFLRYLDIGGFGVTKIGREFSGGGEIKGFPSLKELVIADMPDLEEWTNDNDGCLFPCLTDLEIMDCPKLREVPSIPPTLTRLRISEAGLTALPLVREDPNSAIPSSSSLSSLHINECPNLRSLRPGLLGQQQERLSALEKVTITDCEELRTLPADCFGSLASLRSLHIYNCSRLAVEEQEASVAVLLSISLEDLHVASCSGLVEQLLVGKLSALSHLTNLEIADCNGIKCFPDNALPASLRTLAIRRCAGLQSLPEDLREVCSSLETLLIANCPQIGSLPEKGLPNMLQELYIRECPLLKERCEEGRGRDWEKISHIPRVYIDRYELSGTF